MPFLTKLHNTILSIGLIANILALLGGGLVIPPFKSLYWIQSTTSRVGVYGGCPITPSVALFSLDDDWKSLQMDCWNIFTNGESMIEGTRTINFAI